MFCNKVFSKLSIVSHLKLAFAFVGLFCIGFGFAEENQTALDIPQATLSEIKEEPSIFNNKEIIVSGILIDGDRWFYLFEDFNQLLKFDLKDAVRISSEESDQIAFEDFVGCYVTGIYNVIETQPGDLYLDYVGELSRDGYFYYRGFMKKLGSRGLDRKELPCVLDAWDRP